MTKIKVVQIAAIESGKYVLDDKGRLWFKPYEPLMAESGYVPIDWQQLDLPDEPEKTSGTFMEYGHHHA